MYLILGGLVVAAVAMAASFAGLRLPGWIRALAIGVIPLTMALAVRKQARSEEFRAPLDRNYSTQSTTKRFVSPDTLPRGCWRRRAASRPARTSGSRRRSARW